MINVSVHVVVGPSSGFNQDAVLSKNYVFFFFFFFFRSPNSIPVRGRKVVILMEKVCVRLLVSQSVII